jgi:uncharacterized protein YndB with AHSA1/START domain
MTMIEQRDYARELAIAAPRARVFGTIASLDGLAAWWTPLVSGSAAAGEELTFAFDGLDERIVMRVEESTPCARVRWTCLRNDGHPEWEGTSIVFDLADDGRQGCRLRFRHIGLVPLLDCYLVCESGWERFLASIASYAETGRGNPFS